MAERNPSHALRLTWAGIPDEIVPVGERSDEHAALVRDQTGAEWAEYVERDEAIAILRQDFLEAGWYCGSLTGAVEAHHAEGTKRAKAARGLMMALGISLEELRGSDRE